MSNVFFTLEDYHNDLQQYVNGDVLSRIKNDPQFKSGYALFRCFFITNEYRKLQALSKYLLALDLCSKDILRIYETDTEWELEVETRPILLELGYINSWEENMWNIGYKFDCKLDGWETVFGYSP